MGEAARCRWTLIGDEAMRAPTAIIEEGCADDGAELFRWTAPGMPAGGERLLATVVISVDTARRQAADYDAPRFRMKYTGC